MGVNHPLKFLNLNIHFMSKEGSVEAPIRHPIDFEHPDFLDTEKLDKENYSTS